MSTLLCDSHAICYFFKVNLILELVLKDLEWMYSRSFEMNHQQTYRESNFVWNGWKICSNTIWFPLSLIPRLPYGCFLVLFHYLLRLGCVSKNAGLPCYKISRVFFILFLGWLVIKTKVSMTLWLLWIPHHVLC